jgi:hypothetical protein
VTDTELMALAALVARETATLNFHLAKYGEFMADPVTPASVALDQELRRRKVIA